MIKPTRSSDASGCADTGLRPAWRASLLAIVASLTLLTTPDIVGQETLAPQSMAMPAEPADAAATIPARFHFALIGDLPYGTADELNLQDVLDDIANSNAAFIVHDGDIKAGSESCADELLIARRALLDRARQPLVLAPGDNEWTDCHRLSNGGFDPLERLARLRELFFADDWSLGQEKLRLTRQSGQQAFRVYAENARWQAGKVMFVTLNVPGSNNGWRPEAARHSEFQDRIEANRHWLARAFALAKQQRLAGIVIVIQGNPEFDNGWQRDRAPSLIGGLLKELPHLGNLLHHRDGYLELKRQLLTLSREFAGQVLFVHGDTHQYRLDKPLYDEHGKVVDNFTRLETFGYPQTRNWVRVSVDPAKSPVFTIETRRLPTRYGQLQKPSSRAGL